jgi:hypothetical protein
MPVPYVPRIFESGSLIYSNEHSRQRQTGIVRIFENRAAALSRDVIIFGSSDSYSGFVPFLTAQFKRVFFVWSDTDDGLEYLHSSNVQPDDNAISIVAFRERFI